MAVGQDAFFSFRYHSNYVRSIVICLQNEYSPANLKAVPPRDMLLGIKRAVEATPDYLALKPVAVDVQAVRKCLMNAWTTELMIALATRLEPDDEAEFIGMANNWAVVQAYYSCFQANNGLALAKRSATPDTHEKSRRVFLENWVTRDCGLPPWSLAADKNGPRNFGLRAVDPNCQDVFCDDANYWSLIYRVLRTTREDFIKERLKDARKRKSTLGATRRLNREETNAIREQVRPIGILDYLYRLRIRSNYEDIEMFTEGPRSVLDSREFHQQIRTITSATLLLNEIYIARIIGRDTLLEMMDSWLKGANDSRGALQVRRKVHSL